MLLNDSYVIFDLETTGLYADRGDSIIEIGAVKMKNGEIIDEFNLLVNPGRKLDSKITEITGISDDMLVGKKNEKEAVLEFIDWIGDLTLVAHNAKFDISFINRAYREYNLGELKNNLIDTLGLSRYLESNQRYHNLATLVKRYNIEWDEDNHHRASYDAKGTALIFYKMLNKLELNNITTLDELKRYRTIVLK